jgi:hypothetical protein
MVPGWLLTDGSKIPAQAFSFAFDDLINGTNFSSFTISLQTFRSAAALRGFVWGLGVRGFVSGGLCGRYCARDVGRYQWRLVGE